MAGTHNRRQSVVGYTLIGGFGILFILLNRAGPGRVLSLVHTVKSCCPWTRSRAATIAAVILVVTLPFVALRTHAGSAAGAIGPLMMFVGVACWMRWGSGADRLRRPHPTDRAPRICPGRDVRLWPIGAPVCPPRPIRDSVMLYSTERDLMSDHDATQSSAPGSPRPGQGDEFSARTVLINQDMLDAARAESQQDTGQVLGSAPGAVPASQAQVGSWRPVQPDLPTGPPPEEQTRAYPAGAAQEAAQSAAAQADPYLQARPYEQQGSTGQPSPQPQPGQPAQLGQPGQAAGTGFGGAGASPFQTGQPAASQPTSYSQPAQPAWGASQTDDGAATTPSPLAQSAPASPSAPGGATGQETLYWQGQQPAQPAIPQDQQAFAQQPAPQSRPFSGGRQDGDVGMSSVFPTATARAETEQETFVPAATQPVDHSAPSSAPSVQSQGSAPQWGSAPSSDAAAGQVPAFSDVVSPVAGAPFGQQPGGGALAEARDRSDGRADSVGSWMLTIFLVALPGIGLIWLLMLAFGGDRSASKKNWARATLIWAIIGVVLSVVIFAVLGALGYTLSAVPQGG